MSIADFVMERLLGAIEEGSVQRFEGALGGGVYQSIAGTAALAGGVFSPIVSELRVLTDSFTRVQTAADQFFSTLINSATTAMGILQPFFQLLGGSPWLGEFQAAAQVMSNILSGITGVIVSFATSVGSLITTVRSAVAGITSFISTALGGFTSLVQGFNNILNTVVNLATVLTRPLNEIASGIVKTVVGSIFLISQAGSSVISALSSASSNAASKAALLASVMFTSFNVFALWLTSITALLPRLAQLGLTLYLLSQATGVAVGTLGALGVVVAALSPLLQAFGQVLSAVLSIAGEVTRVIGQLVETLGRLLGFLAEALGKLTELTVNIFVRFLQAGEKLWQMFGSVAARAETVAIALRVMAQNARISAEHVLNLWQSLQRQNISLVEGGQSMILLLSRFPQLIGLAGRLAEAAKDWAAAMGFVSSEVLRDFSVAVTRGNMEMLEHLNIVYTQTLAYQLFAQQIGKSAQDLNAFERSLAIADFLINRIGASVRGVYEETMNSLGKLLTSFQRVFQQVQILGGEQLLPAFNVIGRTMFSVLELLGEKSSGAAQGLRYFFAAVREGVLTGIERVLGARELSKSWRENPIAQLVNTVLSSPQWRQVSVVLGGIVAGLTERLLRFLLNVIANLPQYLLRVIELFRNIYTIVMMVWGAVVGIGRALLQWASGLSVTSSLAARVTALFVNVLTLLANWSARLGQLIVGVMSFAGNALSRFGEMFIKLGQTLQLNAQTIQQWGATFLRVLAGVSAAIYVVLRFFMWVIMILAQSIGGWTLILRDLGLVSDQTAQKVSAIVIAIEQGYSALKQLGPAIVQQLSEWANAFESPVWTERFTKWGKQLENIGKELQEKGAFFTNEATQQKVLSFFNNLAGALQQGAAAAVEWANNAYRSTQPLAGVARIVELIEQRVNRIGEGKPLLFREFAAQAEHLQRAVGSLIDYYDNLYGTIADIGSLLIVQTEMAWRQVEVAYFNVIATILIARNVANTRDAFGLIEERLNDLYQRLAEWAKTVVNIFDWHVRVADTARRTVESGYELASSYTFGASAALTLLNRQREILTAQARFLIMESMLPLGVGKRLEVTRQLVEVYRELNRLAVQEIELISQLLTMIGRMETAIGNLFQRFGERVFWSPQLVFAGFERELRGILYEIQANYLTIARALWFGDVPYDMYARAVERLNNLIAQLYETMLNSLSRPLEQIVKLLSEQEKYWRSVRDIMREFNLGIWSVVSAHLIEAQVLMEKLRILELQAQVNRYNAETYWRIRNEILAIKRELLDLARRPVFVFGMTREQIEGAFREFTRLMGDPRFWLRWRLFGPVLPEAALRAAVWQQQPGLAAIQVFDPRFLGLLGVSGILAGLPLLRFWQLIGTVYGRPLPFDFRTVLQALQFNLFREFFNVPPPFSGLMPWGYYTRVREEVINEIARYGSYLPPYVGYVSPFARHMGLPIQIIDRGLEVIRPMLQNAVGYLAQLVNQARSITQLLTNIVQSVTVLPRMDANLAAWLNYFAYAMAMFQINLPPVRDPREYTRLRREFGERMHRERQQIAPSIMFPSVAPSVLAQTTQGTTQIPVYWGQQQVGTLNLNMQALQPLISQVVQQVIQQILQGYILY